MRGKKSSEECPDNFLTNEDKSRVIGLVSKAVSMGHNINNITTILEKYIDDNTDSKFIFMFKMIDCMIRKMKTKDTLIGYIGMYVICS